MERARSAAALLNHFRHTACATRISVSGRGVGAGAARLTWIAAALHSRPPARRLARQNGETALGIARAKGHAAVEGLLLAAGARLAPDSAAASRDLLLTEQQPWPYHPKKR